MHIRHNQGLQRFELVDDGLVAGFIVYDDQPDAIVLVDTEVAAHHERLGGSEFFVRKVFERLRVDTRTDGWLASKAVVVECPFVAAWLRRHHEFQDLASP